MGLCSAEGSKARVLVFGFLSLLVILAAEECGIRLGQVEPQDLETELRMETMAHIAALVAQGNHCLKAGQPCQVLKEAGMAEKLVLLEDWVNSDPGWTKIHGSFSNFHLASSYLESGDFQDAVVWLQHAIHYKLFPYKDAALAEHWHRALAVPGDLFRKQRLDLADALMMLADSTLEMAQSTSQVELETLEAVLRMLEQSMALREADGDVDAAQSSMRYEHSLRQEITHALSDALPKLRVKELQRQLAERDLSCSDCIEKGDLLRELVPALHLPVSMAGGQVVVHNTSDARYFLSRHENETGTAYLHRVLTAVVADIDVETLRDHGVPCPDTAVSALDLDAEADEEEDEERCTSYVPRWDAITAPLLQNASSCASPGDGLAGAEAPEAEDAALTDTASRSWKLLHNLRIPEIGSSEKRKKGAKESSTQEQLRRELAELLAPSSGNGGAAGADAGGRPVSVCRNLASAQLLPHCQGPACLNVCDLLDGLLGLRHSELQRVLGGMQPGRQTLTQVHTALGSMTRSAVEEDAGAAPAPASAQPQPPFNLGGLGMGSLSEDAARSERDRQLQEQLNRRAKEGTGQYQDDPLVPLTLGACILASFAIYLGRRHRRSLGRAVAGWRLPGIAALAAPSSRKPATLGTSISKERQAAAAALRAALSRADVPMPELEAALEAAEATDVEGPLVRRGRQQLSLRRRRERDAAEAVRAKARAAREKEAKAEKARLKEEKARAREEAKAARAREEEARSWAQQQTLAQQIQETQQTADKAVAAEAPAAQPCAPVEEPLATVDKPEAEQAAISLVASSRSSADNVRDHATSTSRAAPRLSRSPSASSTASSSAASSASAKASEASADTSSERRRVRHLSDSASSRAGDLAADLLAAKKAASAATEPSRAAPAASKPVPIPVHDTPETPEAAQLPVKSSSWKAGKASAAAADPVLKSASSKAMPTGKPVVAADKADRGSARSMPVLTPSDIAAATAAAAAATSRPAVITVPRHQPMGPSRKTAPSVGSATAAAVASSEPPATARSGAKTAICNLTPSPHPAARIVQSTVRPRPVPSSSPPSEALLTHTSSAPAAAPAPAAPADVPASAATAPATVPAPPPAPRPMPPLSAWGRPALSVQTHSAAPAASMAQLSADLSADQGPMLPPTASSAGYMGGLNLPAGDSLLDADLPSDYLSELSQQGLAPPAGLPESPRLENSSGSGSLFPDLAAIWGDSSSSLGLGLGLGTGGMFGAPPPAAQQLAPTGGFPPVPTSLPMDSYQPFGSSSIWGSSHLGSSVGGGNGGGNTLADLAHLLPDSLDGLLLPDGLHWQPLSTSHTSLGDNRRSP